MSATVQQSIEALIQDLKQRLKNCDPNIKSALEAQLKEQQRQLKWVKTR